MRGNEDKLGKKGKENQEEQKWSRAGNETEGQAGGGVWLFHQTRHLLRTYEQGRSISEVWGTLGCTC